ncbi:hypothetical protein [Halobellus captivus]|uniref:hypothetical protein n=1 Tax=Halobellus captivus TaxID=2592614 RepID=UPI00119D006B|nr:hypothetical protein [Halobellus captivus]
MKHYISHLETLIRSLGRDVVDRYPPLRRPVLQGWQAYRRTYGTLVCFRDSLQYARHTNLSPFEVVSVDPDQIEFLVEKDGYPCQTHETVEFPDSKFKYAGTVRGGEWDRCETRFEDTEIYRSFEAHFDHGVPWTETEFFDRVVGFIEDGVVMWGCTNRAEFEQRCTKVDELYESIRSYGYLSRDRLARVNPDGYVESEQPWAAPPSALDEIAVCIGREGDLLFFDGRNRLAIAKLLDVDAIPVWIMVRHEEWQERREAIAADSLARRGLPDHLRRHPDLPQ